MAERQRPASKKQPGKGVAGGIKKAATAAAPASAPASLIETKQASAKPATVKPAAPLPSLVETLQTEVTRLTRELEAATARIATLEQARDQVLNRIDWVIDSLHSLSED